MDTTLKPKEKKLLKRINKSKITVTRIDENLASLIRFGFVSYYSYQFEKNGKAEFSITDDGKRYLVKQKDINFKYWLPIILSNIMALSALVISIISLLK